MPDLTAQLRQYAGYAVDAVPPVNAAEVVGGGGPHRRRTRVTAWTIGVAAAIVLGIFGLAARQGSDHLDIATQPGPPNPSVVASTTPTTVSGSSAATVRSRGIPGTRRRVPGGVSIRAVTVSGQSFWVTLPEDLPGLDALTVLPDADVGVPRASTPRTFLTTVSVAELAGTRKQEERVLPSGATYTRWDAGAGGERTVNVAFGPWTLVLDGPDDSAAETIAGALAWSVDGDGYLVLRSSDPAVRVGDGGVTLESGTSGDPADGVRIHVRPGCGADQATGRPAVGTALERFGTNRPGSAPPVPARPAYGGRWCVSDAYAVEVLTGDQRLLDRLYTALVVSPQ